MSAIRKRRSVLRRQFQCLRCEYSSPVGRQFCEHLHDVHGVCPGCAGKSLKQVGGAILDAAGYSHSSMDYAVDGVLLYAIVERLDRDPLGAEGLDLC